jgi:hypothetical protein
MRVVVGQNTIVKKITVGTPLRVGSAANGSLTGLDDVNGSINLSDGTILQYDSASGKFLHVSPATITGSGLTVQDSGGLGSLAYDSNLAVLTYNGPSSDSIHSLFNTTYDSSALGTLSYSDGTVRLTGPTAAQIRALFSVDNSLNYNETTGEFSVDLGSVDVTDSSVTRALFSVTNDDGDYGSLSYDAGTGIFNFTRITDSDIRGSLSAHNTGNAEGFGELSFDSDRGQFSFNRIQPFEIRSLFNAAGDIQYDSGTGTFSLTVGAHYEDSDARNAFSVNFIGDTARDSSPYGDATYDPSTGELTIYGTSDSNIRGSFTVQDSGGLGSLTYIEKQGRIVYKGPEVTDVAGLLSASEDSLSMGNFYLDSNTGHFHFKLEDDSVRSLFTVHSDDEGGASLRYDSATGVFTFSGPSTLDLRQQLSVDSAANIGDGSFTYDDSFGIFTYIGPSPAETRAHFTAGLGLDYNESTGTFRLDSTANIVTSGIVTDILTVNDFATINQASFANGISTDSISSTDSINRLKITGGEIVLETPGRILLDTPFLHSTDNRIILSVDDSDVNNYQGGGFQIGGGSNSKYLAYSVANDFFAFNTGLYVPGELTGTTIDSLNKRIDELPDSAQMKGILSAGPGLSYDNVNGIYRIISSGVTAGTYGSVTEVPQITVDSLGIVTNLSNVAISTVDDFIFDSTSGNLKIVTATDSFNVGITLDPYSTADLLEDSTNLYYTDARVDSNLSSNRSGVILRNNTITGTTVNATSYTEAVAPFLSTSASPGAYVIDWNVVQEQVQRTGSYLTNHFLHKFIVDSSVGRQLGVLEGDSGHMWGDIDKSGVDGQFYDPIPFSNLNPFSGADTVKFLQHIAWESGGGNTYNFNDSTWSTHPAGSGVIETIYYSAQLLFERALTTDSFDSAFSSISAGFVSPDAQLAYNSDHGAIVIGKGTTSDVTLINSNGQVALSVPTGTRSVNVDSNLTVGGYIAGPQEFIIDPAPVGSNTGAVKILGDLQVEGTVTLSDKTIVIADSAIDSSALDGAGITFGGTSLVDNPTFQYSYADQRFVFNRDVQGDDFHGNEFSGDLIAFNTTQYTDVNVPDNLPTFREGNLFYFQGPDALTYSNDKINVKIGQDEIVRVYNDTGSAIPKGKVVYTTGAVNDFPTIALAKADNFDTIYETMGITSHEIGDGEFGYVTVRGLFGGLDTTGFTPGDIVHVSHDSAGELLPYMPPFPNYPYEVGTVLIADSAGGGNVGGCIQIRLKSEVFEGIRVQGNSRFDGNLTIAGDLNLLGSETQTQVANLRVSDNFVFLAAGDTVTANALDSGLNDLEFIGTYQGDSDVAYFVKISNADSAGDTIIWSFDSNFSTLEPFDSAGGPTSWNLTTNGLEGDLRYGVGFEFTNASGHDSGERWRGAAAPTNLDLGLIGNYNPADGPFARAGAFRDNADGRFKFFQGYTSEITSSVNTADSSYEDAPIQFSTGYGNIVGNLTGNVTGRVSDLSNHNTSDLTEDPAATDSSGTQYFTSARARSSIFATDAGGDGSFTYDSATGEMVYTGPSEAEFYQHFKDNADSWGDLIFDSAYGNAGGGFKLHERHILRHEEVFSDSWVNTAEYFLVYSGTTGGLKKVRGDTLASTLGGGGGGAGGGLFGYINM